MKGDLISGVEKLIDTLSYHADYTKDIKILENVVQVLRDVKCLASGWDVFNKDEYYKGEEDGKSND